MLEVEYGNRVCNSRGLVSLSSLRRNCPNGKVECEWPGVGECNPLNVRYLPGRGTDGNEDL